MEGDCLGRSVRFARGAVLAALVAWFALQCAASARKLAAGKIGTTEWTEHGDDALYPSLTMCPMNFSVIKTRGRADMVAAISTARPLERDLLLLKQGHFTDGSQVTFNPLEDQGYPDLAEGTLSRTIVSKDKFPLGCVTYNPPQRSRFGFPGKVTAILNATGVDAWIALVHNRGMAHPNLKRMYGWTSASLLYEEESGPGFVRQQQFEILRAKLLLARTPSVPCDDTNGHGDTNGNGDVMSCIYSHWESSMGCKLPWRSVPGTNKTCHYDSVLKQLGDFNNVREEGVAGCKASCERFSYTLRDIRGKRIPVPEGYKGTQVIEVGFVMLDSSYTVKEEYVVYDYNSLIADIGGYLGLLLGQSILTSFELLVKLFFKID